MRGTCGIGKFRADQVDRAVWTWAYELLRDPARILRGYHEARHQLDGQHAAQRAQLDLLDEQIAVSDRELAETLVDKRKAQSQSLKDRLGQDTQRLGQLLDDLRAKRAAMAAKLGEETITNAEIEQVIRTVAAIHEELDDVDAEADVATQRKLIEALNLRVTIYIGADGAKWIDIQWLLPADRGTISTAPVPLCTETVARR